MKIKAKILTIMLVITVIPLSLVGFLALKDAKSISYKVAENAKSMGTMSIRTSTESLNKLGENIIMQKAVDVAKQMEIYIMDHPEMTIEQLQSDPFFFALATQKVGETGYTTAWDSVTSIDRFHASPRIMNLDLHTLSEKLPSFWALIGGSENGKTIFGYYDFLEADNTIRQKYMYILPVGKATADGVVLNVAATTYIDEFSKPVKELELAINSNNEKTLTQIKEATEGESTRKLLTVTLITIIITIIIAIIFATTISNPIRKLKEAAEKVTNGDFDIKLPSTKSKDEISELASSIEMLIVAIKNKK